MLPTLSLSKLAVVAIFCCSNNFAVGAPSPIPAPMNKLKQIWTGSKASASSSHNVSGAQDGSMSYDPVHTRDFLKNYGSEEFDGHEDHYEYPGSARLRRQRSGHLGDRRGHARARNEQVDLSLRLGRAYSGYQEASVPLYYDTFGGVEGQQLDSIPYSMDQLTDYAQAMNLNQGQISHPIKQEWQDEQAFHPQLWTQQYEYSSQHHDSESQEEAASNAAYWNHPAAHAQNVQHQLKVEAKEEQNTDPYSSNNAFMHISQFNDLMGALIRDANHPRPTVGPERPYQSPWEPPLVADLSHKPRTHGTKIFHLFSEAQKKIMKHRIREIRPYGYLTIQKDLPRKLTSLQMAYDLLSNHPDRTEKAANAIYKRDTPKQRELAVLWMHSLSNEQRKQVVELIADETNQSKDDILELLATKSNIKEQLQVFLNGTSAQRIQMAYNLGLVLPPNESLPNWQRGLGYLQQEALLQRMMSFDPTYRREYCENILKQSYVPVGTGKGLLRAADSHFRRIMRLWATIHRPHLPVLTQMQ
jgi:hypothetical protein